MRNAGALVHGEGAGNEEESGKDDCQGSGLWKVHFGVVVWFWLRLAGGDGRRNGKWIFWFTFSQGERVS